MLRALHPLAEDADSVPTSPLRDSPVMRYFGDYELLGEIARGGMGIVYRARQVRLDRVVALKLLAAGEHASPQFLERFQTEAKAAATLDHPNIVPIYEVGEAGGQSYFTMRLVEGGTLAEHVRTHGGPLSNADAASILSKLARAVHFAHQRGVLHRDLKPGNVLLDSQCEPLLTDFGLAKLVEHESTITHTQSMLGTPAYMSPEQAAGRTKALTTAADVYGLGAILYELLTGAPPFTGSSAIETVRRVLDQDPVRPSSLLPGVDHDLEVICLKCLEKEPGRRYPSAEALADDLDRFLRQEPIQARPVGPWERARKWVRRHPRRTAMLGTLGLAIAVAVIVPSWMNLRLSEANRQAAIRAEENREQLVRFNVTRGIDLMNKGDLAGSLPWLVQALQLDAGHPAKEEIHRVRLQAVFDRMPRLVQILDGGTNLSAGQFSPDGRSVILQAEAGGFAQVWDVATGRPVAPPLRHQAFVRAAAFNPAGDRVVTASYDGTARIWDAASGQPVVPELSHGSGVTSAVFTPDGRRVATGALSRGLTLWDAITGAQVARPIRDQSVHSVAASPDGRWIAAALGRGIQLWNIATGELSPLIESTMRFPLETTQFSDDSSRVLGASGEGAQVWDVVTRAPLTPILIHPNFWVICASFGPKGMAVVSGGRDGLARVWGTSNQPPTVPTLRHDHRINHAEFSPDGLHILTASSDRSACLWDARNGEPRFYFQHGRKVLFATFSRDGRQVLTLDDRTARIWDLAGGASGSEILHVTSPYGTGLSEDGRQLLTADAERNIHAWEIESGRELPLSAMSSNAPVPRLVNVRLPDRLTHPDGRRQIRNEDSVAIRQTSDEQRLTSPLHHRAELNTAAFSPDGRFVATAGVDRTARVWEVDTGDAITPPLRHPSSVYRVEFGSDGRQVAIMNQGTLVEVLRLDPDPRPIAHLNDFARLLSGRFISSRRSFEDLDDRTIFELHRSLRERYPDAFRTTPEEQTRWHWRQSVLAPSFALWGHIPPVSRTMGVDQDPARWEWRARAEAQRRDWTNAATSYSQALSRSPADPRLWRERGMIHHLLGRPREAKEDLSRAVELAPGDANLWTDRAKCWLALREPLQAVSDLDHALQLAPDTAEARELRGQAGTALGQWEQALSDFAEARRLRNRLMTGNGGGRAASAPPSPGPADARFVNLDTFFNGLFTTEWIVPNDTRMKPGLPTLPHGLVELDGTVFDLRGVAQLAGSESRLHRASFPAALRGIIVPPHCARIHFLHGLDGIVPAGTEVGRVVIHRRTAPPIELPLRYGENIAALFSRSREELRAPSASIVWSTIGPGGLRHQSLARMTWDNPDPDREIVGVDYESALASYGPCLFAITADKCEPARPNGTGPSETPVP